MTKKKNISKELSFPKLKTVVFVIFSVLVLVAYLFSKRLGVFSESGENTDLNVSSSQVVENSRQVVTENSWGVYTNAKYGYEIGIPRALLKKEYENQGGYIHFVRFEEREESQGNGIAIGIREGKLDDEVSRIKEEFGNEGRLTEEREVDVGGVKGVLLNFEPDNEEDLESRGVVVFEKEGKVFSISTVPEQIEKVIEGFKFLN